MGLENLLKLRVDQEKARWDLHRATCLNHPELLPSATVYHDTIELRDDTIHAHIHWHTITESGLVLVGTVVHRPHTKDTLQPFYYAKPTGSILYPEVKHENAPRTGYRPLLIIDELLRAPNHWDNQGPALFAYAIIDGVWQTRVFPQTNIPHETWIEAERLLS
jgi:hypothetical protein